jgi:hypothetical protein
MASTAWWIHVKLRYAAAAPRRKPAPEGHPPVHVAIASPTAAAANWNR